MGAEVLVAELLAERAGSEGAETSSVRFLKLVLECDASVSALVSVEFAISRIASMVTSTSCAAAASAMSGFIWSLPPCEVP